MVQRERCPCSWKNCRDYAYNEDDIWYGFVQIRKSKSNSAKKNELRRVVEHHLRIPRDIKAENKQYSVARHHWCRLLLGDYYKTRRISTSIPSYIAKQYRIDEQINRSRVTINSSVTHYTAAPSNPEASVKEWHNLQCSQKSTRRISREENQARLTGNTSLVVATHVDAANVTTDDYYQQAISLPPFDFRSTRFFTPFTAKYYPMNGRCVGIMSQTIDFFASLSNANKGICLTY